MGKLLEMYVQGELSRGQVVRYMYIPNTMYKCLYNHVVVHGHVEYLSIGQLQDMPLHT